MANHRSALKRIRQTEKRTERNRTIRTRARSLVKKARTAQTVGNATVQTALEATRLAIRELDRAASKGVLHKRNAARRKSRLMKQLNALQSGT
ncbi:MAG: 30S ribosomal protein S20 [Chloroflexota bacterium]|nr:30S ribosomal protein S20 [Chloroflexota bacterium]